MGITKYYWTTSDIEKAWKKMIDEKTEEDNKSKKVRKKEVRRNFKNLLEKMMPEGKGLKGRNTEHKNVRDDNAESKNTEAVNATDRNPEKLNLQDREWENNVMTFYRTSVGGDFIFENNDTPRRMQKVLEMLGEIDLMSYREKEELKENLVRLLPKCRTMDEIETFMNEPNKKGEIIEKYRSRYQKVEKMVDDFYIKTRSDFLYQKKFFVEVQGDQYVNNQQRLDMYMAQLICLNNWQSNWDAFMKQVISIRKVEKCPIGTGKRPIPIKCLYENEAEKCGTSREHKEDGLDEKISVRDDWREKCTEIVKKIVDHELKEQSVEDFDYLIVEAFEELEEDIDMIREIYLEKRVPKLRSREEIRNEKINKWSKDINNSHEEKYKGISKEDLGCYYDALEDEARKDKRGSGRINLMEMRKNMSESEWDQLAKDVLAAMFYEDTKFIPLEK